MLNKNKKYSFEELKDIFKKAVNDVISNQLKDDKDGMDVTTKFAITLSGTLVLHNLQDILFGKDDD